MSEKRFEVVKGYDYNVNKEAYFIQDTCYGHILNGSYFSKESVEKDCKFLNDQDKMIKILQNELEQYKMNRKKIDKKRFKLDFDNCSEGCVMDRYQKYGQYYRLYDFGKVGRQQIVNIMNGLQDEIDNLREKNFKLNELIEENLKEIKNEKLY